MEFSFDVIALLFIAAFVSGFIDAIAGGGGLITIPALLSVGIPPAMALGTNKLQACGGSFSAALYFIRHRQVEIKHLGKLIALTFVGAALGAITVQLIDISLLKSALPFLILILAVYFLFSPSISDQDSKQRISYTLFAFTAAIGIGFYDGLLGPATGSFFTLAFVLLLGFNLTKAVAHTKVLNFTSNFAALVFFILGGVVLWKIGLIMLVGQFIGGNLGAKMAITKGKQLIKPLIVTMSFLMVAKMLWEQGYFA
ncbi:TSUP family transporter [Bibersteinia trehalosi]|uniref:TSUP family transporter n=1 Tax=Bibersteinia trehalosi TaxID=47735 RepID=UPI003D281981